MWLAKEARQESFVKTRLLQDRSAVGLKRAMGIEPTSEGWEPVTTIWYFRIGASNGLSPNCP